MKSEQPLMIAGKRSKLASNKEKQEESFKKTVSFYEGQETSSGNSKRNQKTCEHDKKMKVHSVREGIRGKKEQEVRTGT